MEKDHKESKTSASRPNLADDLKDSAKRRQRSKSSLDKKDIFIKNAKIMHFSTIGVISLCLGATIVGFCGADVGTISWSNMEVQFHVTNLTTTYDVMYDFGLTDMTEYQKDHFEGGKIFETDYGNCEGTFEGAQACGTCKSSGKSIMVILGISIMTIFACVGIITKRLNYLYYGVKRMDQPSCLIRFISPLAAVFLALVYAIIIGLWLTCYSDLEAQLEDLRGIEDYGIEDFSHTRTLTAGWISQVIAMTLALIAALIQCRTGEPPLYETVQTLSDKTEGRNRHISIIVNPNTGEAFVAQPVDPMKLANTAAGGADAQLNISRILSPQSERHIPELGSELNNSHL